MKTGLQLLFLGVAMTGISVWAGGWWWLLLWLGLNFLVLGVAYTAQKPGVLGKQQNGTRQLWSTLVLLPYLLLTWSIWHTRRLVGQNSAYNELQPELKIGRRLLASEMPEDIDAVLDLTCEFSEPEPIRGLTGYVSLPILDASAPREIEPVIKALEELNWPQKSVYIHCAQGYGRTAMAAAAALLWTRSATSVQAALDEVYTARPGSKVNAQQKAFLDRLHAALSD